jgi:serine/threonine protein kinase
MADVKEMRIFSADQILVPDEFPKIMKDFTKEVVRKSPEDIVKFSKAYFETLLRERGYFDDNLEKMNV